MHIPEISRSTQSQAVATVITLLTNIAFVNTMFEICSILNGTFLVVILPGRLPLHLLASLMEKSNKKMYNTFR